MNLLKVLEYAEGTTKIYDNFFLEMSISDDAYIDVPFLEEGKRQLEAIGQGNKFYVISEGVGFFRISREARILSANAEYSSHLAAVAILTDHISIKLMVDLYNKINKPPVITRAFTERDQAILWLEHIRNSSELEKGQRKEDTKKPGF